jgi:3-oxoacyl-(acyl-carrier-protein) synthase
MGLGSACASGIHALGVGFSFLQSGLVEAAIVGGTESPLSEFRIAHSKAIGIYATDHFEEYPCRPFHPNRSGTVYSEGSVMLTMSLDKSIQTKAEVLSYAADTEKTLSPKMSLNGIGVQKTIKRAVSLAGLSLADIDIVLPHGTGTLAGDSAEINAIHEVFKNKLPRVVLTKWCCGHMLGASGTYSLAIAAKILEEGYIPKHPYFNSINSELGLNKEYKKDFKHALVLAMGFGANTAATIIRKV